MSFLYPFYLWALAGISIPFIIHLFSKKKGKPVLFPSVRFIKTARSMTGRRRKIEEIILLALRTLLLFSLLLILPGPVLKKSSPFSQEGFIVFLVDDSFSMNTLDGSSSPSQTYKDILTEALSFIRKPARISLVYLSGESYPFTHNYSEIASIIRGKDISHQTGNLSLSVEKALKSLEKERGEKTICFFTDLQKKTWENFSLPGFSKKKIRFLIFDIGQTETENIGFKRMYLIPGKSEMTAEVQNWGEKEVAAEIIINGDGWQREKTAVLKGGSLQILRVDIPETSGRIKGHISNRDILDTDNSYYFSIAKGAGEKVLLIGENTDEVFYLKKALKVGAGGKTDLVHITAGGVDDIFPEAYASVFISGSGRIPDGFSKKMYRYARDGGNIVYFPGSRVVSAGFNQDWQVAEKEDTFLMPARLKSINTFKSTSGIGDISTFHPLFSPLQGMYFEYTRTIIFKQIFTFGDISGDILMKTSDNRPLLIEKKIGKGSIFLFGFPTDDRWTNIHFKPFFPVLINNILNHFSGKEADIVTVGEEVRMKVPYGVDKVYLSSPDGEKTELQRDSSDEAVFFVPDSPGFWIMEFRKNAEKLEKIISVNVDSREGDLKKIEVNEIAKKMGGADITVVKKAKIKEFLSRRKKTREISYGLLNAALILLLVEIALSSFLRNKRQGLNNDKNKF